MRRYVLFVVLCVPLFAFSACSGSSAKAPTATATAVLAWTEDGRGNFHGVPQITGGELTTLPDGLQYLDLHGGAGAMPQDGEEVTVQMNGFLRQGGSFTQGPKQATFVLGRREIIKGIDEAVRTMKVGGSRRIVVPPTLGYGADGLQTQGGVIKIVPANATLVFDLELVSVKHVTIGAPFATQTPTPSLVSPKT